MMDNERVNEIRAALDAWDHEVERRKADPMLPPMFAENLKLGLAASKHIRWLLKAAIAGHKLAEDARLYRANYLRWTGMDDTEAMKDALAAYEQATG